MIHVFQHGDYAQAQSGMQAAQDHVMPGGIFAFCGEAATTPNLDGDFFELHEDDSYTVNYRDMAIHAFSGEGLDGFEVILPPRKVAVPMADRATAYREAIWRRTE